MRAFSIWPLAEWSFKREIDYFALKVIEIISRLIAAKL